jgi:glyoxylase-like metal-dependent hydrolase (beta-lactamase superfamily II)
MAKITSVLGNSQKLDGGAMFGNAPKPMWSKWLPPDDLGRIPLKCRALLIQHAGKNWLLEAGIGAFFEPKLAARFGVENPNVHELLQNLNQLGVKESDIDYVILSHLHFDHAGGLLVSYEEAQAHGERLLFPNATYIVGKEAWKRALNPHSRDKASFIPKLNQLLLDSKRLLVIDGDTAPGAEFADFKFYFTDGHTPGQMHTLFKGPKEKIFFCGDIIPGIPWIHVPITMGYDRFAELVINEKEEILKLAESQNWNLYFTHDNSTAMAKVYRDEQGKYLPKDLIHEALHLEV